MKKGFTLLELLIVVAVLAVLSAVVILTLNPGELLKKARDSQRVADLNSLKMGIGLLQAEVASPTIGTACTGASPCKSSSGTAANSGGGWAKIDFSPMSPAPLSNLPMDPTNDATYYYSYAATGTDFEINAVLESGSNSTLMVNDGGDDDAVYEVGTKLDII